ncbi:hypothetical protein M9458_023825, partial [Cirrhinus mrigala]
LTPLTRGQLVEHQVSAEAPSPSGFGFPWSRTPAVQTFRLIPTMHHRTITLHARDVTQG